MSEQPAVKIDLGVADALKFFIKAPATWAQTKEEKAAAELRKENLEQAVARLETLRQISRYMRQLYFQDDGLRYRLRAFSSSPTRSNARRLAAALGNTYELVLNQREAFLKQIGQSVDQIRALHPELADGWERAERLKRFLWELTLAPQSMMERLPFIRQQRYTRLASELQEDNLDQSFEEVNKAINSILHDLANQIAAYEKKVEELSARPPSRGHERRTGEVLTRE